MTTWPTPNRDTLSLGWALVELIEHDLLVPTGPHAGRPLKLTREQVDLVVAWYQVDHAGRFVHRRGAWRLPKKWGKSPLAAALAYCELVGPVVFSHFDSDGDPVGVPHPAPWVQIAACSLDQSDNTYLQLVEMLRDSPAVAERRLDVGLTRILCRDRAGRIEPVTAAAGSREGQPISFALMDETHLWTRSNGGKALAAVIRRNAAPMGARTLEQTNAFIPGEGSVAEVTHEAVMAGRAAGVLYVAREAPAITLDDRDSIGRDELVAALASVYGDAATVRGGWVDLDRLADEFGDPSNDLADCARFFLNQLVAPSESLVDLAEWQGLVLPGAALAEGDVIGIGFDGSDSGDATALYAVRHSDWCLFKLGVWEPPEQSATGWRVDRAEVDAVLRRTMQRYKVARGYFDPAQWQYEIDVWAGEFGNAVMRWPHSSDQRIGPACERFASMVDERTLRHDGDPVLLRHLANARQATARNGWWRPARRHAGRPIDAASAAISAVAALGDAVAANDPALRPPAHSGAVFVDLADFLDDDDY